MTKTDLVVGKTKSGRPWKSNTRQPMHTMTTTKNVKTSWAKKMALKRDHKTMKTRENELRAARNEAKETERVRLETKAKVAAENEEKQNRAQGQLVLDPKKQKKYEAQEARRRRKMARKKNKKPL